MFSKLISAVLLTALAGRVLAQQTLPSTTEAFGFNVTLGTRTFPGGQALAFDDSPLISGCDDLCTKARTAISPCAANPNVTSCFCDAGVTTPLQDCQQCLFTALISANKPAPDVRVGSNVLLGGWAANCNAASKEANLTLAFALALVPPPNWDGPFVAVFPTAIGWVLAVTGGVLGSSLIYMLCNM